MIYLLDTDTLVFYLRGHRGVRRRLLGVPLEDLCTSSICIGELYYGAAKSQRSGDRAMEVDRLRAMLPVLPFAAAETKRFGHLKAALEAHGERLADADLMIAATALEHGSIVVTGNARHFRRIDDLRVEDWIER